MLLFTINLRALKPDEHAVKHTHSRRKIKRVKEKTMSRTEEVNKMTENVYKVKNCLAASVCLVGISKSIYIITHILTVVHNHRGFWTSSTPV